MIDADTFQFIVSELMKAGYAQTDISWAENCAPPSDALRFGQEVIFVICNSGMKYKIAGQIYSKVMDALESGASAATVFGHAGKCSAIDDVWKNREQYFAEYMAALDKVAYCETLPFIGGITKYHLAKNFGAQVAKPDVHLQRLADLEETTPQALCERIAAETEYKVATIDVLLWRACATGLLDSRTGLLR